MGSFYIKNNKVIDHISEINKKKEINDYAIDLAKKKNKEGIEHEYKGNIVTRKTDRTEDYDTKQ